VSSAGISPQPVQRPIPIWMGGGVGRDGIVDPALKRVARIADGWCPLPAADRDMMNEARQRLQGHLKDAGRDPDSFSIEMRTTTRGGPEAWAADYETEKSLGTDYFTVVPSGVERGVGPHLEALRSFKEAVK